MRLGMTLREFRERCPLALLGWVSYESSSEPAAAVRLGSVTVTGEFTGTLPNSTLYRLVSDSPALATADGLGPGSTYLALRARHPLVRMIFDGCVGSVTLASAPGLGWVLAPSESDCRALHALREPPLPADVAERIRIEWVFVFDP